MGDRVAPGRIPQAAVEAARRRADGGDHALSAALDACPVLGLTEKELTAMRSFVHGVYPVSLDHLVEPLEAKLLAALRSVSEDET